MIENRITKSRSKEISFNERQRFSLFIQIVAIAAACSALVIQQEFFQTGGFTRSVFWLLAALVLYLAGGRFLLGIQFSLSHHALYGCSCLAAVFLFGARTGMPFLMGAFASLAACATVNGRIRSVAARATEFSILVLSTLAVMTLTSSFAAKTDSIPLLPQLLASLWRMFGGDATSIGEMFIVDNMHFVWPIRVSLTQMGVLWILPFAVISTIAIIRSYSLRTSTVWFLIMLFAYPIWRILLLASLYLKWEVVEFFFSPGLDFFLSLIPISLLLCLAVPKVMNKPLSGFSEDKISFKLLSIPFVTTLLLLVGILLPNPGAPKKGRVLVDEGHGPWEWSVEDFSRDWYGGAATYNYNCIMDYVDRFFTVDSISEPLSFQNLRQCDVLILKTPSKRFSEQEKEAIKRWVRDGGGLYLIGDHTNVFGMTDCLNPVAGMFGIQFEYDATYDLETGSLQVSRDNTLWRGTALNHMPEQFLWGTSCSLTAGARTSCDFIGRHVRTRYLDYGRKSNFADPFLFPRERYGPILQMASRMYGKGRVFAFSDSTVFSNFWAFFSGKSEIFVGVINWLNYRNTINYTSLFLITSGILFLIYSMRHIRFSRFLSGAVAGAPIAVVFALLLSNKAADLFYPFPTPRRETRYVFFDREHSDINLPDIEMTGSSRNSFQTFFTWIQKLDLIPKCIYNLHEMDAGSNDVLLMIYPSVFNEKSLEILQEFLEKGGVAMILDGPGNQNSQVNLWTRPFGMAINYSSVYNGVLLDNTGKDLFYELNLNSVPKVTGGNPVLTCNGNGVLNYLDIGKGRLYVSCLGDYWTDVSLGISNSDPTPEQEKLSGTVYYLMEQAFGLSHQGENFGYIPEEK